MDERKDMKNENLEEYNNYCSCLVCVVIKKRKEKPMRGMRESSHDGKVDEDQKTGKG